MQRYRKRGKASSRRLKEVPKVSRLHSTITKYSGTGSFQKTQAAISLLLYVIRLLTAEERIENKREYKTQELVKGKLLALLIFHLRSFLLPLPSATCYATF